MPTTRRTALFGALAAIAGGGAGPADRPLPAQAPTQAPAQPSGTQTASPELAAPELTTTERLSHATLRLVATAAGGGRTVGTGFLFSLFRQGDDHVPVLVVPRGLLAGAATLSFRLNGTRDDGVPDYRAAIPVTMGGVAAQHLGHPDPAVDLAILAFNPVMQQLRADGKTPFLRFLGPELIPTEEALWSLSPVEDVLTIGFPEGGRDGAPLVPIFRRGVTATPAYLEFDGRREFLIDAPVWPGQDGAPVLMYETGYSDTSRPGFVIGSRISLLGVLASARVQAADGTLLPLPPPEPGVTVQNTLGVCTAAARVLEFEPLLARLGRPVPPGYRMRAAPT